MKVLSFLLSMVNSLIAILILLSCVSKSNLHWEALGRISGRVLTGVLVILIGVLTFRDGVRPVRLENIILAGLLVTLLGVTCSLWGVHLSILSGDVKNAYLLYGGSLFVQGIATIGGRFEPPDSNNL